jgi:Protein of unknown function (DUF732)
MNSRPAACAVLLCVAALSTPAPASADPTDDSFLGALANYGININNPDTAIAMAHTVCAGFDQNQNSNIVAMKVMKDTTLTAKQSGYFVGLSISAYCPQYKGKTDDSFDWLNPGPPLQ